MQDTLSDEARPSSYLDKDRTDTPGGFENPDEKDINYVRPFPVPKHGKPNSKNQNNKLEDLISSKDSGLKLFQGFAN